MFQMPYEVTESEIEPTYRHVSHYQSLRIMELARLKYLEAIGWPNEALIKRGLFIVIGTIQIAYKREVFVGYLTVTCEELRIEGRSMYLKQRLINEKEKDAVVATVECVLMSGQSKRAVLPPAEFSAAFLGA